LKNKLEKMKKYLATAILLLTIVINSKAQVELNSGGTGAAYTLSVPGTFSLRNGIQVTFKAHTNSSAAATMNVSGTGAVSIMKDGGSSSLTAGDIKNGQIVTLAYDGAKWQMMNPTAVPASSGTVTSVDFTVPAQFTISGTPLTTSGTIGLGWQSNSQNLVLATPNGSAGTPTFRSLVANDIPNLDASKITTGLLPLARGGTNAALTATNGGIVYSNATGMAITAAGTSGQVLQSNGAAAPSWVSSGLLVGGTANKVTYWTGTNSVSANNFFSWDNTNVRLGVGVATPLTPLHIASAGVPAIGIQTTGSVTTTNSSIAQLNFTDAQAPSSGQASILAVRDATSGSAADLPTALTFLTTPDGSSTSSERMRIKENGNVSIGNEYPTNTFNILSVRATQTDTSGSSGTFIDMHNTANSHNAFSGFRFRGSYNSVPYADEAYQAGIFFRRSDASNFGRGDLIFATKTTASYGNVHAINDAKMVIKYATGNVGVGTNVPSHKLHVEGGRMRVANGSALADLYQSGVNTLLETSGQFQIHANGAGPEFTIDDGNANFYVPLLIQDGSQANNRVLTSNASGYATWTDLSAISSGTTAWTKAGSDIYPTTISDFVGIGTTPTSARLSVVNNLAGGNALLITNETGGTTSVVSGTKGGRISVTANDNNPKVGLEVQVGGTGTGQQNALFVQASGAASAAFNRGLVAGATNNTSSNIAADLYADGNSGTNYGLRVNTAGTQAATKYAAYLSSSGSGTKYGVYATGENMNYFSGLVGVGTTPSTTLDVANSTIVTTSRFTNTFSSGTQKMAVYGWATGTGAGANLAGAFEATGSTSTNYGVQGNAYGNSGAKVAIYGSATGTGTNTAGYFTSTGGTSNYAIVVPSGGGNVGIGVNPSFPLDVRTSTEDRVTYFYNDKNTANTTFGVYGGAYGAGSGEKRGGSFDAVNGTGINIGVRAFASGGATNWAAYFIGNTYVQGRLGINETVPAYELDVSSTSGLYAGRFKNEGTGGADGLRVEVVTTAVTTGTRYGTYSIVAGGLSTNYGVLGIAQTSGTTNYGVYGSASGATTNWAGYFVGNSFTTAGAWTPSDEKLKTNISLFDGALAKIDKLPVKTYNFNRKEYAELNLPTQKQYGIMAQDLQAIFPEMVLESVHNIPNPNNDEATNDFTIKAVNYSQLIPVLVRAIQEQQEMINNLKREVDSLKNK
jgi:hypothetical protein